MFSEKWRYNDSVEPLVRWTPGYCKNDCPIRNLNVETDEKNTIENANIFSRANASVSVSSVCCAVRTARISLKQFDWYRTQRSNHYYLTVILHSKN